MFKIQEIYEDDAASAQISQMNPIPPQVPPELVDQILGYLVPEGEFPLSKPDLKSCSLVCKTWHELSAPHLFRSISFAFADWPQESDVEECPSDVAKEWWTAEDMISRCIFHLPRQRFIALFNQFQRRPQLCGYVQELKLTAYSHCTWLQLPTMMIYIRAGGRPVDKSLFLSTAKLFPRLRHLLLDRTLLYADSPELDSQSISLESLTIEFSDFPRRYTDNGPWQRHNNLLTDIVNCFNGLKDLQIRRFADDRLTIFSPSYTPALQLRSLSISGTTIGRYGGLLSRTLLDFPNLAALQSLEILIHLASPAPCYDWSKLLETIGPQLRHLKCRVTSWSQDVSPVPLPYLSTCTNLRTMTISIRDPRGAHIWDLPDHMLTSYLTVPDPQLRYVALTHVSTPLLSQFDEYAAALVAPGFALLELHDKFPGLVAEFRMTRRTWTQRLLDVEPFRLLDNLGCVKFVDPISDELY